LKIAKRNTLPEIRLEEGELPREESGVLVSLTPTRDIAGINSALPRMELEKFDFLLNLVLGLLNVRGHVRNHGIVVLVTEREVSVME
jgi:hypothetical protein